MVVFDATILLALLHPDGYSPRHPITNELVDSFRERIGYLVSRLEKDLEKIIIPTPALSEILVRASAAGPQYLDHINTASVFRVASFDKRAAIEVAAMTREAIAGGDKRGGIDATWAKIKFDRQIIAIAKVEGASIVYSDDEDIYKVGRQNGLTVIRTADLPLPPVDRQGELDLTANDEQKEPESK